MDPKGYYYETEIILQIDDMKGFSYQTLYIQDIDQPSACYELAQVPFIENTRFRIHKDAAVSYTHLCACLRGRKKHPFYLLLR